MPRRQDLELLIHTGNELIAAYQQQKQLSDDPKSQLRCDLEIRRQRTLLTDNCSEYVRLCQAIGAALPPDIAEACASVGFSAPPLPHRSATEQPMKLTLTFSQVESHLQVLMDGGERAGQASAVVTLPPTPHLEPIEPRSRLRTIGQELFQALFVPGIRDVLTSMRNQAQQARQPVTLRLRFDRNAVAQAQYPWELLHDGDQFLRLAGVELVRYVMFQQATPPVSVQSPLTVAFVASSPTNLTRLNATAIADALRKLPNIRVDAVEPPSYSQLLTRLARTQPSAHVFHFEGHGDIADEEGGVFFEDGKGRAKFATAESLAVALHGQNIALAVINACHGADVQGITVFNGVAPALILAGVPAVIGMQGKISDHAAVDFATALYDKISRCAALTDAMAHAIRFLFENDEWYKPVLYLRSADDTGRLLTGCSDDGNDHQADGETIPIRISGRVMAVSKALLEAVDPLQLAQVMERSFGPAGVETLAWDTGVPSGALEGTSLPVRIRSLIDWHRQRGSYALLVAKVIEARPNLLHDLLG